MQVLPNIVLHPPCPAPALHRVRLHGLSIASLNGAVGAVQGSLDEGCYHVLLMSAWGTDCPQSKQSKLLALASSIFSFSPSAT